MIRSPVNKSCLFFSGLSKLLVFTVVTFALFSAAAQDTTPPPALSEALDTRLDFVTGGSADWFDQSETSQYGGDAAQSGFISEDEDSWLRTTVNGTGTVSFYWKVSSEQDYDFLEFHIDGKLRDRISGEQDWQQKTYTITTPGVHVLEWRYVKYATADSDEPGTSNSDCGWVDNIEWVPTPTPTPTPKPTPPPALPSPLSEALDTALSFTTGGSAAWFGQTTMSYYGPDAAQSGAISHGQNSWMQARVNGTGTVSFYWKVSSEDKRDFLEFYIDGELQDRISGSVNWQQKTYTIFDSGPHALEWRYVKDKSVDSGSDAGWVDKVVWVTPTYVLSEALDTALSFTTGGSANWFSQTTIS